MVGGGHEDDVNVGDSEDCLQNKAKQIISFMHLGWNGLKLPATLDMTGYSSPDHALHPVHAQRRRDGEA